MPAAFGRLCVETMLCWWWLCHSVPAAFGRLCVETKFKVTNYFSGGGQPPSGGCVLKLGIGAVSGSLKIQPPSGGCVLKQNHCRAADAAPRPAAFGRLCVETPKSTSRLTWWEPAAFGRLCVETLTALRDEAVKLIQPPSGGCVLKRLYLQVLHVTIAPAAFGRLCVETVSYMGSRYNGRPSRLRAAVC